MSNIEEIRSKYIQKNDRAIDDREPLKQNLQADINKVDAIIRKLSGKKAPTAELNRLRGVVVKLLGVIDSNDHPDL